MSGTYDWYSRREFRRRRREVLARVGLCLLAAVTGVVVMMALGR